METAYEAKRLYESLNKVWNTVWQKKRKEKYMYLLVHEA